MKKIILVFLIVMAMLMKSALATELNTAGTNIGIGTTSIQNALSIASTLAVGAGYTSNTAPTNGVIVQGNVGIGSTAPGTALDVNGTVRDLGQIVNGSVSIGTTVATDSIDIQKTSGNYVQFFNGANTYFRVDTSGNIIFNGALYVTNDSTIDGYSNNLDFSPNQVQVMTMTPAGNIGIGTSETNPQSTLQIFGKCNGLSGDLYLNAGRLSVCTSGTFPACSASTVC